MIEISEETYEKLVDLARTTLFIAHAWNDHNFESEYKLTKDTSKRVGIEDIDQANEFITALPRPRQSAIM